MQEKLKQTVPKEETIAKYTIKDSVFSDLFKIKKYLMQLYRTLHPEDKTSTENELSDITIKNVLTDGIYNYLGFLLVEKFLILLEAQSLWTLNIIIRALLYLAQTYHDYFERTNQNLYKTKKVKVICENDTDSIINQYIIFCKVYNEQMKLYGRTRKTITETIRICKDRNILREYILISKTFLYYIQNTQLCMCISYKMGY